MFTELQQAMIFGVRCYCSVHGAALVYEMSDPVPRKPKCPVCELTTQAEINNREKSKRA